MLYSQIKNTLNDIARIIVRSQKLNFNKKCREFRDGSELF
jgi:hypothetical protein